MFSKIRAFFKTQQKDKEIDYVDVSQKAVLL